jgi:hypothetical protein
LTFPPGFPGLPQPPTGTAPATTGAPTPASPSPTTPPTTPATKPPRGSQSTKP